MEEIGLQEPPSPTKDIFRFSPFLRFHPGPESDRLEKRLSSNGHNANRKSCCACMELIDPRTWYSSALRLMQRRSTRESPPRAIYFNRPDLNRNFCHNRISTTKYTILTFLPRFFYDQFRRYANLFFLVIIALQQIPGVSPTGQWPTALTLGLILIATAAKELNEDYKRYKADDRENGREVLVYRERELLKKTWTEVVVGDIVKVNNGEFFPADLLLLNSSEHRGNCYIETSNLDGETNLKSRQSCKYLNPNKDNSPISEKQDLTDITDDVIDDSEVVNRLKEFQGSVDCEGPNNRLHGFVGSITSSSGNTEPLNSSQILLRGAQLRNTQWIYGLVIYTGHDTKLMRNASKAPLKRSNMDHVTNKQVFLMFIVLLVLSLLSAIIAAVWSDNHTELYYLALPSDPEGKAGQFFISFLTFIVLYNNLIPISQIVTVEVCKKAQADFINNDLEMYDPDTDTPAQARNSNLNEELGQVKYIFADKTGTLTQNIMEFRACSVAGQVFSLDGRNDSLTFQEAINGDNPNRQKVVDFLKILALCHSIIPERTREGMIYQGSSPDELALVQAARSLGIVFEHRTQDYIYIDVLGVKEEYRLLNLLDFSSSRKRMSVIVRTSNGIIKLLCKGADSVMNGLLSANQIHDLSNVIEAHLTMFAEDGLRTLCVAETVLSEDQYEEWNKGFIRANSAAERREEELDTVASMIEKDLQLLGCTAVEDKLQESVPESIEVLRQANIKIWVLTGDKRETARNIGFASKQLTSNMLLQTCEGDNEEKVRCQLEKCHKEIKNMEKNQEAAFIIDGKTLEYALDPSNFQLFLDHALACKSVICCRVSPAQKAAIVQLVKTKVKNSITLAIGDGANDVGMIQAAHVGVGISGREGLQATLASDYSISQFKFLVKLLLVHGTWNYNRLSKVIPYCFYKNIILYVMSFWFAIYNGFSGQTLFERWNLTLYNILFTAFPPFVLGVLDQDVPANIHLKSPLYYLPSQRGDGFNFKTFWWWIGTALFHSVIIYFVTFYGLCHEVVTDNGQVSGSWIIGCTIFVATVITVCLKGVLESEYLHWWNHIVTWSSIVASIIFLAMYSHFSISAEIYGLDYFMFRSFHFYLFLVLGPAVCLLLDVVVRIFWPSKIYHQKQKEVQKSLFGCL